MGIKPCISILAAVFIISLTAKSNDLIDSVVYGVQNNAITTGVKNTLNQTDQHTIFLESNCTIPFNSLSYVGVPLKGNPKCVGFAWHCTLRDSAIDPFDGDLNPSAPARPRSEFFDGYYYCTDGMGVYNDKKNICLNRAQNESSFVSEFRSQQIEITFSWDSSANKCNCALKGDSSTEQDCSKGPPKWPAQQLSKWKKDNFINDNANDPNASADKSSVANQGLSPDKVSAQDVVQKPTEPTKEMLSCTNAWIAASEECKKASEAAQKSCDSEDKKRAEAQDIFNLTDTVKNMYVSSKALSGAQQQCFTASLITSGTREAYNAMSKSCKADMLACTNKCAIGSLDSEKQKCEKLIIAPGGYDGMDNPNKAQFDSALAQTTGNLEAGTSVCSKDAKDKQSTLDTMLNAVGGALGDSVNCMCKLATNVGASGSDCSASPTVNDCVKNPNLMGCQIYSGIAICTPGANYNAQLCNCQLNPKSAGCPGGSGSGSISGFGSGITIRNSDGTPVNFGSPSGGLRASAADLAGGNNNASVASNLKLGDGPNINSSAAPAGGVGGAGGDGGASDGGGSVTEGLADPEKSGGLSGLMTQAKNYISNALGLGKTKSANNSSADKKTKVPYFGIRGMASSGAELASKNMDIWKTMNACTSGDRCKSNENNYILGP